ncbi:MAG: PQQ-dependent sugar dehydrogenase [Gaiellaceae bacterium]
MRRFGVIVGLAAAALPGAACGQSTSPAQPQREQLRMRPFVSGLDSPVYVIGPRSQPGRLYVVEQAGVIRVVANGKLQSRPFLDIRSRVRSGGEQGLLSVAFHPRYTKNHRFFVYLNDRTGDVRVYEFRSNGTVGLPSTGTSLLRVNHREFSNHDGGQLQFGPDGRLYAGTGDGGGGGDPHNHSQNLGSRLGKLLRLNVDKPGARWQIAGYGLRNPWRFTWDRATRDLYIGDVGESEFEEVDVRTPRQQHGLNNYGWHVWEGRSRYASDQRVNRRGTLVFPIVAYNHSHGCSITGGYVYRGKTIRSFRGRYIYGDYCAGTIWSLRSSGGKLRSGPRRDPFKVPGLSSFGEDAAGEIYATSLNNGTVYKLSP